MDNAEVRRVALEDGDYLHGDDVLAANDAASRDARDALVGQKYNSKGSPVAPECVTYVVDVLDRLTDRFSA
jgi:hypothetical protein